MKRLLFHTYHFPPIGGSGAQRPLRMARYLLDHGYVSTVVTGSGATSDRWAPEDETLSGEVPSEIRVLRVAATPDIETSGRWRRRFGRWLRLRSPWARWWIEGSSELAISGASDSDLVYCWMQPYDSAEAATRIADAIDKPWVADMGDPWALDEMMVYPSSLHRRAELARMGRLLASASAIVMSTNEAVERLRSEFPSLASKHVLAIPNGFDAGDFAQPPPIRLDGKFRIVHTGYLHTELGLEYRRTLPLRRVLGGNVRGLDILTRSHVYLVQALNLMLRTEPELADVLELHLAGVTTETDKDVALSCPVARLHGYVTHAQALDLMRSADLLFLPMQNLPPGTRATIVPGKAYEYLASGVPILGAVPDGDARDILEEAGNAVLCWPDGVEEMAAGIRSHLERFKEGAPATAPDPDVVGRFEYRLLASRLADVFDAVTV